MFDYVIVFILGACVGSFLNVCIYRLPRNKSIVFPASFCPACKRPIQWYDNIPILSYLLLGGRCRSCKAKISFRYFFVEIITAVLWTFLYARFSLSPDFFRLGFFFSLLIVVSFIDIDYHSIPVSLCFLGILVGLLFPLYRSFQLIKVGSFYPGVSPLDSLPVVKSFRDLIMGLGFVYLFKLFGDVLLGLYLHYTKKESIEGETEALGLGDVDFMGMVAVFLGVKLSVLAFFIAPFVALGYSLFAIIFKKSHLIPYLPYLSFASFISFLWGANILAFILKGY